MSLNLPKLYRLSARWSGVSGRLLFCGAALSVASVFLLVLHRLQRRMLAPATTAVLGVVVFTLLLALVTTDDPYRRMESVAPDGLSTAPWLQSVGMVLHPPVLYIGLISATIPLALLIGAYTHGSRNGQARWMGTVFRWAAWAWAVQTIALGLGMWWTYATLGEAQYWRSTDAEIASFVAWSANALLLLGTCLFVSREGWRMWFATLVMVTFDAAICSLLLLRDAVPATMASVLQTELGQWVLWSLTGATMIVVYLVSLEGQKEGAIIRLPSATGDRMPLVSILVMPGMARRGAALSVFGMLLTTAALLAQRLQRTEVATLTTGDTLTIADPFGSEWTFTSQGISTFVEPNHHVAALALLAQRGGSRMGLVSSEKQQLVDVLGEPTYEPWTQAGILRRPLQDVYVAVSEARDNNTATVRIAFVRFASWVWLGLLVAAGGSIMMMWTPPAPRVGIVRASAEYDSLSERTAMTANNPHTSTSSLDPVEAAIAKARAAQRECSNCGPRPEPQADYCSTCGRYLGLNCPSCGTLVVESGARFCSACGVQLVTT
ncbi:MAG: cytochrome c biogenesis protein CcsA [Gemmatimonadaceae bacterium]|nr:cytochrome c biogenesis protein CcsA [Gemmatimonadaceae bacterium]